VYDAFSKRECLENLPFEVELPTDCVNEYTYLYAEFGKAQIECYEDLPYFSEIDECNARLNVVIGVPVYAVYKRNSDGHLFKVCAYPICSGTVQKDNIIRFPIGGTVYAPRQFLRQGRFEPYAESIVEVGYENPLCNGTLVLSLGFFFIIKVVTEVCIKVPNFGYCPIPDENEEPFEPSYCEQFLNDEITPFPSFFPTDCV
jgi:hypothetical protein